MAETVVYFELSWAILSTIGLTNVLFGVLVLNIATPTSISILPIIVSAACALANGLCYFAFYADYPLTSTVVASAFADISWLIQEAGLSFYSYIILWRVLRSRSRTVFLSLFWSLIAIIVVLRIAILITRIRFILGGSVTDSTLQHIVNALHVAYFTSIALVEIVSSAFLLRKFATARRFSANASFRGGLFSYLMRSTEVRMAFLAVVGTMRAVTYSFQTTAQTATSVSGQLDRFAYTLECVFPVMMFIDVLASKLAFANDVYAGVSSRNKPAVARHFTQKGTANNEMYPMPAYERRIEITGGVGRSVRGTVDRDSSQEHIIITTDGGGGGDRREGHHHQTDSPDRATAASSHDDVGGGSGKRGAILNEDDIGISKVVEFEIYESQNRD